MKGLVLGPLHSVQADQPNTLNLQELDPNQGTEEELRSVFDKAHRKGRSADCRQTIINRLCGRLRRRSPRGSACFPGISIILDLTPNYLGSPSWFTPIIEDIEKVQVRHRNGPVVRQGHKRGPTLRFSVSPRLLQSTGSVWAWTASSCPTSLPRRALPVGPSCRPPSRPIPLKMAERGDRLSCLLALFCAEPGF